MRQVRSSGGIWFQLDSTNFLVDPGPGSLVRCAASRPRLDPSKLDAIILTHRHLDHSADANIMIEAMTEGGFTRKGGVFAPKDALEDDPVILCYMRDKVERVEILQENSHYSFGNITFNTSPLLKHSVETYGLTFHTKDTSISLIPDTSYFEGLDTYFSADVLIVYVAFLHERPDLPHAKHLSLEDARRIIRNINPKAAILTHFGMTMVKAKPWELAQEMSAELGTRVLAANDGMTVNLEDISKA